MHLATAPRNGPEMELAIGPATVRGLEVVIDQLKDPVMASGE
jgi:hypothetical protein